MELDIPFIGTAIKQMMKTVPLTLAMTVIPIIAGFFIALGNITVRIFRIKWLLLLIVLRVFFRSTPAILHIMLIYLGVPLIADQFSRAFHLGWSKSDSGRRVCHHGTVINGRRLYDGNSPIRDHVDTGQAEAAYSIY